MIYRLLALITRILSTIAGRLTALEQPHYLIQKLIRVYANTYKIDLSSASLPIGYYSSLQSFFLRDLKAGSRPIPADCSSIILSPVDGTLREVVKVEHDVPAAVKGVDWQWGDLLVDPDIKLRFENGHCFNFYLSPSDYHHVHTPFKAVLKQVIHQPGALLPVNDWSLKMFPKLFSLNERMILLMQADGFEYLVVFVGALNVGSIQLEALPSFKRSDFAFESVKLGNFSKDQFNAGDRLGSFSLGSSILLILPETLPVDIKVQDGKVVYGQPVAELVGKLCATNPLAGNLQVR